MTPLPLPRSRPVPVRLLLALLALPGAFAGCGDSETAGPPPIEIPVVEVVQRDQPIALEMVGQTRGSADIPIRARVEGVLLGMHFQEGGHVHEGDPLYSIDPVPYESKVVEAQGHLSEAYTRLAKTRSDLQRIRPLAEMNAVSQVDLDSAAAQYEAALGAVQAAEARLEQAKIELSYTEIAAPIDGRIGISAAKVGEFVGKPPNPVVLNFVSRTDPIRVRFSIDERRYLQLARRLRELEAQGVQGRPPSQGLELILADGSVHPHRGELVATAAAIDPDTGTFTLEADFPNPEELVLAGQFARVRAIVETRKGALLVPQRAIAELQGKFRVFVVGEDGAVEMRPVSLGPKLDQLQIVESGMHAGERVALEIARLRPGMVVVPKLVTPEGEEPTGAGAGAAARRPDGEAPAGTAAASPDAEAPAGTAAASPDAEAPAGPAAAGPGAEAPSGPEAEAGA